MKDIAIYGAGGFGREVACLIRRINESKSVPEWNLIGFFDDNHKLKGKMISHFGPCIGGIEELNEYDAKLSVTIPIGNPRAVRNIVSKIRNRNIEYPNIVHPDFVVNDPETFAMGNGNIVQSGCSVSCNVEIGDFNVLNGGVILGHDVIIGNYNSFMPAIRVSGGVVVGDCNFLGVGSIILQQIHIGNDIRLGAGSVLMRNPKDTCLYVGNPAKKMEI